MNISLSSQNEPFFLTHDHIELFYTNYFSLSSTHPITITNMLNSTLTPTLSSNSVNYILHQLYDLFSYPLTINTNLISSNSAKNAALTSTISSITTVYPKFTFPDEILSIFKDSTFIPSLFCNKSFEFPSDCILNPANTTSNQTTNATIDSVSENLDKTLMFPHDNFDSEQYIQRFLHMIGDSATFASHLRHTLFLHHFFKLLRKSFLRHVPDITALLISLLLSCLIHFHIICEHYNIESCGSLDFSFLIDQMTHPEPENSPHESSLSQYSDDEFHFLTSILPNAFKSSPMYPGGLNQGILFPLAISPSQSVTSSQYYTKLLPSSYDFTPPPPSPSKILQKVPTNNIPFSIFIYLALLNSIMFQAWPILLRVGKNPYLPFLFRLFLHIPNLPLDLDGKLVHYVHLNMSTSAASPSRLPWNTTLCLFNFKLHQHVRFPILQTDPLASLRSCNSFQIIALLLASVKTTLQSKPMLPSHFFSVASIFGLKLVHIAFIMMWAQQFYPHISQVPGIVDQSNVNDQPFVTSFTLAFNQPIPSASFIKKTFIKNIKPKLMPDSNSMNFLLPSNLMALILTPHFLSLDPSLFSISVYISSSLLLMILSLILHHDDNYGAFEHALCCYLHYDLDHQCDSAIRSFLNLLFEYKYMSGTSIQLDNLSPTLHPFPINSTLSKNTILSTNTLPCINHMLASMYYGQSIYQQNYDLDHQCQTNILQSQMTHLLHHDHGDINSSTLSLNCAEIVEHMIEYNNGHAVYRKQLEDVPATYPSAIPYPQWFFEESDFEPLFIKDVRPVQVAAGKMIEKLWISFFHFFRDASIFLLSNDLYCINLKQDVLDSLQIISPQIDPQSLPIFQQNININIDQHYSLSLHPSLQSSTKTTSAMNNNNIDQTAQCNDIPNTMNFLSHPSTLLGINPQIYCIPYMAIQHNCSRTLFHLISCHAPDPKVLNPFFHFEYFMSTLLYLNFLHTFLCKPIAIISITKEVSKEKPLYLDKNAINTSSSNHISTIDSSPHMLIVDTLVDTLNLWKPGILTSIPISPLSDQHPLHNLLNNNETFANPSILTYSSLKTDLLTSSSPYTFYNFCSTSNYQANLCKHSHLPPFVVKQLYYIYTEALIFIIQGFSYASFRTPWLNDPTILPDIEHDAEFELKTTDVGISTLSSPGCPFTWGSNFIRLGPMNNLTTTLQWNQLTEFGGTIQQATQIFGLDLDQNGVPLQECATMVQNDSYHQHIMDLYNDPQQVQYSFKPQRNIKTILPRGAKTTVPDYVLDQQRTGTIAIAYEWSSAMVQHSIELFIELLLNEGSYEFVSQIDFSDDKQPLAEEYVVDFIPHDPANWGDKDKWSSNLPQNCTDDDIFPLYQQFIPTKYQAQIPTLATASIYPKDPIYLPHSIYNPDNTTQEQRDALVNYYNENTSLTPAFVFGPHWDCQCDQLQSLGFKTPTRGHLPYFYNLSTDEQDELYKTFSFVNLTSATPSSSSSSISVPDNALNPSLLLNINFTEYFNKLNDISLHFQKEMLQSLEDNVCIFTDVFEDEIAPETHQKRLSYQSEFLIEHYSSSLFSSNQTTPNIDTTTPIISPQLSPNITPQDIIDIFTTPCINGECTTPTLQYPQVLPPLFTIPTAFLIDQIQATKKK